MRAISFRAFQEVNGFSIELLIRYCHLIYGMKAYGIGGHRSSDGISARLLEAILARLENLSYIVVIDTTASI